MAEAAAANTVRQAGGLVVVAVAALVVPAVELAHRVATAAKVRAGPEAVVAALMVTAIMPPVVVAAQAVVLVRGGCGLLALAAEAAQAAVAVALMPQNMVVAAVEMTSQTILGLVELAIREE